MKTCTSCLQSLPEKEVSYREAAPREEVPTTRTSVPLKQKYPKLNNFAGKMAGFLARMVAGIIVVAIIAVIISILTVGVYWLGMFVANDICGWEIGDIKKGPGGWLIGLAILIVPIILYAIGDSVVKNKEKK